MTLAYETDHHNNNDDDWPLPPDNVDGERYSGQGRDLSNPINQGQRVYDLRNQAELSQQVLIQTEH